MDISRRLLFTIAFTAFLNFLVWLAAGWNNSAISAENGWLESFQAICLLLGSLIFAAAIYCAESGIKRLMYSGLTLFYVNFLLREINVRNLGLPESAVYFLGGAGRNWALASAWAILFALFLRRRRQMTGLILSWIKSAPGVILVLAGFFYVAAVPFDKKTFGFSAETHELFEEILEAQAALLMFFAALLSFYGRRGSAKNFDKIYDASQRSR